MKKKLNEEDRERFAKLSGLSKAKKAIEFLTDDEPLQKAVEDVLDTRRQLMKIKCKKHPENTLVALARDGVGMCDECVKEYNRRKDGTEGQLDND